MRKSIRVYNALEVMTSRILVRRLSTLLPIYPPLFLNTKENPKGLMRAEDKGGQVLTKYPVPFSFHQRTSAPHFFKPNY